ncbi:MAG TPA: GspH/FimT family pseudopilin, partial [Psychromonas sp.]
TSRVYMEINHNNHLGFTLIELLVSITVLLILVSVSVSNYSAVFAERALIQKTEHLYHFLRLAKTQAIQENKQIYVHFCQDGNSDIWKMAMAETAACDCFTANACLVNGLNKVEQLTDGKMLFAGKADITFSGQQASYKPMRFGVNSGSVTLNDGNGNKLKVIQGSMRLRICSPDKAQLGYKKC